MTAAAVVSDARNAKPGPRQPTHKRSNYGSCTRRCNGGGICVCDARPHFYHTCNDPSCPCHDQVVAERPPRPLIERVALAVTQGNMLDLWALMQRIGGKRTQPGTGRAAYTPLGRKNTG